MEVKLRQCMSCPKKTMILFLLFVAGSEAPHVWGASLYHARGSCPEATHLKVTSKFDKIILLYHASCVCWHGAAGASDACDAIG